ncbi:MAG: glucose 1-dehydrogenase [Firmicutes bacterium]|nr:glucose 1-dehydrogenase [Bacillota bacterium]
MRLADKVAIITGAGSGIGRATSALLAREGAMVVAVDINKSQVDDTAQEILSAGGACVSAYCDVTNADDIQRVVDLTLKRYQKIDVLFNNAGMPMSFTPTEEVSLELWQAIMAVNVTGIFLGCRAVIPIMKSQRSGVILNTASTAAVRPRPGLTPYNASKGAVTVFTRSLALELAPYGIRVNAVNPVAVDTPMLNQFIGANRTGDPAQGRQQFEQSIPLGRLATPMDIAFAVLYLASEEAAMVTGVCLDVAGGRTI